jgi:hypothetical protein
MAQSVVAWGPSMDRYELVECDMDCDSTCRAWIDGRGRTTSPWLNLALVPGLRHGRERAAS